MTNVVEPNSSERNIKLIDHAIVANAQFEFRSTLEPLIWEVCQPDSHVIHGLSDQTLYSRCQGIERLGEGVRLNLERGGHNRL